MVDVENWLNTIYDIEPNVLFKTESDTLALDHFFDTNGTSLDVHTMDAGSGWTLNNAQSPIILDETAIAKKGSFIVRGQTTADIRDFIYTTLPDSEYIARLKFQVQGLVKNGMIVRINPTDTSYIRTDLDGNANTFSIKKRTGATEVELASVSFIVDNTEWYTIEVNVSRDSVISTLDGGYKLSVANSMNTSSMKVGLYEESINNWYDEFYAFTQYGLSSQAIKSVRRRGWRRVGR
ncbi:MAG: hypothetical protein ACE5H1_01160 [Thermodesulfobacteriota bacterium]